MTASLPAGIDGHFGTELRRFVLAQYHQGQMTVPRLVTLLRGVAGEITLMSPEPDLPKAEAHFNRALARAQHAKSWELRAAMSMARLWRDQGKRQQAHDLLAPVYGWFTEGFDTLDLKQTKGLLDELS
jgi:predicted ATPase